MDLVCLLEVVELFLWEKLWHQWTLHNTLINKIEKMDQQLREVRDQVDVNCRDLGNRLDRLETNRRRARRRKILEMAVGYPGESEFNPTI